MARKSTSKLEVDLKLYLVPCSCGTTFAVSENYDRQGTVWGRYLKCPNCGKRHDPKNRLLRTRFSARRVLEGGWVLANCQVERSRF